LDFEFDGEFNAKLEEEEPKLPLNFDEMSQRGSLEIRGWTIEELLSQGVDIDDCCPSDEQEPAVKYREYTAEELEQFEVIEF
jgi:hypothetical protein